MDSRSESSGRRQALEAQMPFSNRALALFSKVIWWLFLVYISLWSFLFSWRILQQYIFGDFETDWVKVLPKMNKLWYPAFGMFVHWIGGVTILLIGVVQLFAITRTWDMRIHRILGTLYILGCFMASLGGNLFIYTAGGCVGGMNMDIAFSIAGWTMFVLTTMTYYHARQGNRTQHRNWAIRLWGQGIASLMYRVWYMTLSWFGYQTTSMQQFHRPVDEFLDWWFFVPNLVVAELVVWNLMREERKEQEEIEREEALIDDSEPDAINSAAHPDGDEPESPRA